MVGKTKKNDITHFTVDQYAKLNNVSPQRIRQYLSEGRLEGASKITNNSNSPWLIPANTKYTKMPIGRPAKESKS